MGQRPERLTFEITESALMADPAAALAVLERIAAIGCKLSLDDFGTGYSSLAYLQQLPINELKIDRSFVVAMTRDDNAAVIVRAVVQLAKGLGLSVVAEGVESEDAFRALRALGCDQVQGYWFGPAMSGDELLSWLREPRRARAHPRAVRRRAPERAVLGAPRPPRQPERGEIGCRRGVERQLVARRGAGRPLQHGVEAVQGRIRPGAQGRSGRAA